MLHDWFSVSLSALVSECHLIWTVLHRPYVEYKKEDTPVDDYHLMVFGSLLSDKHKAQKKCCQCCMHLVLATCLTTFYVNWATSVQGDCTVACQLGYLGAMCVFSLMLPIVSHSQCVYSPHAGKPEIQCCKCHRVCLCVVTHVQVFTLSVRACWDILQCSVKRKSTT